MKKFALIAMMVLVSQSVFAKALNCEQTAVKKVLENASESDYVVKKTDVNILREDSTGIVYEIYLSQDNVLLGYGGMFADQTYHVTTVGTQKSCKVTKVELYEESASSMDGF